MVEHAVSIPLIGQKRYVLLAISLAVAFTAFMFIIQSGRSDAPDHGDWWTDMNQIIAGRNFNLYGFSSLRFGATRDNGPEVGLSPAYYTPGPSFPAVMLGLLYRLGLSTSEARILPLLVSSSALIALYLLVCRMVGDWRAGIIASMALAASAPFRLLSDTFAYPSYDFAAKTWTILFITLGGLATGWRRAAWLLAAGAGAFATVALLSFEMAPAIAAYGVLFPLLFASSTSDSGRRFGATAISGLSVVLGLLAGAIFQVAHSTWLLGGADAAVANLMEWFARGAASGFSFAWTGQYLTILNNDHLLYYTTMLVDRMVSYFPIHLLGIALLFCVAGLLQGVVDGDVDWRAIKWLQAIFFSEIIWFLVFRQDTNEHVHTISHLSISVSVAVAVAFIAVWRLTSRWGWGRLGMTIAGAALFSASLANVGVKPHGNLQQQVDWTQQKQQEASISSLTPSNAVVVMALGNLDPSWQLFIGRTFVRRPGVEHLEDSLRRPLFLITEAMPGNPVYKNAMERGRLIKKTQEFVLFDMNPNPVPWTPGPGVPGAP